MESFLYTFNPFLTLVIPLVLSYILHRKNLLKESFYLDYYLVFLIVLLGFYALLDLILDALFDIDSAFFLSASYPLMAPILILFFIYIIVLLVRLFSLFTK